MKVSEVERKRKTVSAKYTVGSVLFLLCTIPIFTSCEFLLLPAHLRENVYDEEAQISNFTARQNDVDNVRVGFGWRPPLEVREDTELIEEVKVLYRVGGPPTSHSQNLPPDAGGSKTFSQQDGTFAYLWDLDLFDPGDEVWFALYPKVGMRWYAPRYAKVEVKDSVVPTNSNAFSAGWGIEVDKLSSNVQPVTNISISNDTGISERFAVVFFNLPEHVFCTQAFIQDPSAGGTDNVVIYPMARRDFDWGNVPDIINQADKSVGGDTGADFVTDLNGGIDITHVVNRAILLGTDAFLIWSSVSSTTNTIDVGTLHIDMSYVD